MLEPDAKSGRTAATKTTEAESETNPFLTNEADSLWDSLAKHGKPVSKETLLRRIKAIKDKQGE